MSASPGPGEPRRGGAPGWDRIKALFHEAVELDPEPREALLARAAESDPALVTEVRSLLAHAEVSGFLAPSPVPLPVPTAFEGDRFGPYRILEPIGRGGMGVVYRATRDDESFTKDVAIKMIDPGMRSEDILKRFRAERQILAMLDHPNIARLIDGGTARDGSPYLVMEYVAGRPLLADCDAHRLGVDRRLELFLTVCDAVQFAHQRLVIHRDLKSDNILVTEDGSPRLLDFGIAKLVSADPMGAAATVTAPMNRMLTPEYASPEQVRGETVTVASDVYSLGVVLYELLTGSRPLQFATRTPEEILRVVTQEDPPLPSQAVADATGDDAAQRRGETRRSLKRRLTGDLDSIVLKALEKEPTRRYGSVDQLAQDVRRHLEGLPILARGQTTTYLLSRFVRRHRAAVVTGGLVAASLIAGLAGTSWQAGVATRRFNDVRALAHAVVFDLHDAIASLPGSTKARELLVDHALRYLDDLNRQAKGDRSLERELGLAYSKIGDVQGRAMFPNLGQTAAALESYDKAIHLLGEVARAQPESAAIVHDWITVCQRRSDLLGMMGGRIREALDEAMENRRRILAERARRPDDPRFEEDLAINYSRGVTLKTAAGDTLGAFEDATAYLALAEKLFRSSPAAPERRRGALIANTKVAQLRAARGDRDSALSLYLRAEDLARQAVAALPNNTDAARDLSIILCEHGLFVAAGGDIDSAIAIHGRGMRISERLCAQDPADVLQQSDVASDHYEIGTILVRAHRYEEARARFEESFDRYARIAARDSANFESRIYMARSSRMAGESCRALWQRARSSDERSRWRSRALDWLDRSLTLYRGLGKAGALAGEDTAAPAEVDRVAAELRGG